MKKIIYIILVCLFFILGFFIIIEEIYYEEIEMNFTNKNSQLHGKLILPKTKKQSYPLLVFVHGDGAMPYDAYGYYNSLWNALAKNGIASYSWDKAGVENSSGNWQEQSMEDRAQEVISAISMLNKNANINKIGLVGFSQAGWVIPFVSSKINSHDFTILVSGAINWMEQGGFMTKQSLLKEHYSKREINDILEENKKQTQILSAQSYEEYIKSNTDTSNVLTESRFNFIKLNWQSDATKNLKYIQTPTLAIFGKDDQNVNISNTIKVYKDEFLKANNNNLKIKVFKEAQHTLLKSRYFDEQNPSLWFLVKLWFLGEEAFVEGYNQLIVDWTLTWSVKQLVIK